MLTILVCILRLGVRNNLSRSHHSKRSTDNTLWYSKILVENVFGGVGLFVLYTGDPPIPISKFLCNLNFSLIMCEFSASNKEYAFQNGDWKFIYSETACDRANRARLSMMKRVLRHPKAPDEGPFFANGCQSDRINRQPQQRIQAGLFTVVGSLQLASAIE